MPILILLFYGCKRDVMFYSESYGLRNLALAENGAAIRYRPSNLAPYWECKMISSRPVENLINGNRSSFDWDKGEGWEAYFSKYTPLNAPNYRDSLRLSSSPVVELIVEFPERYRLGEVIVYTLDSPKYPARDFGVRDLAVEYRKGGKWIPCIPGRVRNNRRGRIIIRFAPVMTDAIRLLIYDTNDSQRIWGRYGVQCHYGVIRLIEIEAYGGSTLRWKGGGDGDETGFSEVLWRRGRIRSPLRHLLRCFG